LETIYTEIHAYLENPTEQQREDLKAKAKKQGKAGFKTICINYKWLKDNGQEEALFYNPGKEIERAYKTKEITREEMLNNPLRAVYEKYVLPISYGLVEMEYPAAALAALDKTQPDYEQAIKKAEKIAEGFLKAIQEKTGCTLRQLAIISKDYIWRIYADCYNIYHKPEYQQMSLIIKEYAEKTAEIENRIKEPVTDRENDIFYDELNEIEKEFNRLSEIHYYKTHQIEEARKKTKEILQRIFPGKADLIRAEISIADKINPLGNYIFLPNNSIHQLIKQTLNSPQKVAAVKKGIISTQRNTITEDISITYNGQDGSIVTIELARAKELFKGRVRGGAKMYNFFLQKTNEQYRQEKTTFLLQELVDLGIYANKDSAYRGIKTITDKMMNMYIEGIMIEYEGGKKKERRNIKAALIAQRDISYTACHISLPPIIRENTKYITILPEWNYRLSENGFMLLDYIYFLARQNTEKIKKEHRFTISLEAIRVRLGLPTPEKAGKDPKRLILEPIEKAIEDIEDQRDGTDIKITPAYNPDYKNIHEYLQGYIEIQLDNNAEAYMFKIAKDKEKELKQIEKRKEKARLIIEVKAEEKRKTQAKTLEN
jgi:hypothetical protein